MGAYERRKGANGERELFGRLRAILGDETVQRNLSQTRQGGADSNDQVLGWTIEVKRWGKRTHLQAAVDQVRAAAQRDGGRPVVMYRLDRGEWTALPVLTLEEWATVAQILQLAEVASGGGQTCMDDPGLRETGELGETQEV